MTQLPSSDGTERNLLETVPEGLPTEPAATFDPQRMPWAKEGRFAEQTTSGLLSSSPTAGGPDQTEPRLVLKGLLAEGGFGEVWISSQTCLRRVVAVKRTRAVLLAQHAESPSVLQNLRGNLVHEALLLATLDHPNIVPIYDLVWEGGGEPLLAMKLARGRRWKDLLDQDRAGLPAEEFLAKHLPVLVSISNAVAFAHSRGIVHRDLKPAQVMVGEFGEVLLMDWGLAMVFDEAQVMQEGLDALPLSTRNTASNPSGTVAYMAPEQTMTTTQRIGPWTDVFLLGGTLYYLLTGTTPYGGDGDARQAFLRAAKAELVPPATLNPSVPRELATLCEQALQPVIEERLVPVQAFIEGLQAYLTGATRKREAEGLVDKTRIALSTARTYKDLSDALEQLGRARVIWPDTPASLALREQGLSEYARLARTHGDLTLARLQAERMLPSPTREALLLDIDRDELRQARHARQRRLALIACGLLALATAISGYQYTVRLHRARARADVARNQADGLIQYMLGDLYSQLEPVGQTRILKRAGAKAMEYFDGLPGEDLSDATLLRRALVLHQVGRVQTASGDSEAAIRTLTQSIGSLEGLLDRPTIRSEARASLIEVCNTLANILRRGGRSDDALRYIEKQERLLEAALAEQPANQELLAQAAASATAASRLFQGLAEMEQARARSEKALALRQEILRAAPASTAAQRDVSISHNELGRILSQQERLAPAREQFERAVSVAQELARQEPDNTSWKRGLGICKGDLGALLLLQGSLSEARQQIEESLEVAKELRQRDPDNAEWSLNLAWAIRSVGELSLSEGDARSAERTIRTSEEIVDSLVKKTPENWSWRRRLGAIQLLRGEALLRTGRIAPAEAEALAARALLAESKTDEEKLRAGGLGWASLLRGEVLLRRGLVSGARAEFERASNDLERADRLEPTQVLRLRVALRLDRRKDAETIARRVLDSGVREPQFLRIVKEAFPGMARGLP